MRAGAKSHFILERLPGFFGWVENEAGDTVVFAERTKLGRVDNGQVFEVGIRQRLARFKFD